MSVLPPLRLDNDPPAVTSSPTFPLETGSDDVTVTCAFQTNFPSSFNSAKTYDWRFAPLSDPSNFGNKVGSANTKQLSKGVGARSKNGNYKCITGFTGKSVPAETILDVRFYCKYIHSFIYLPPSIRGRS